MAQKVKPFATAEDVEQREALEAKVAKEGEKGYTTEETFKALESDKQLASMSTAEVEALNLLYVPGFS